MPSKTTKKKPLTPAERKRRQYLREKEAGWTHIKLRVAPEHAKALRDFAKSLPAPGESQTLPGQQALPFGDDQ